MYTIPFNRPFFTGNEWSYIQDAMKDGKLSGNGKYTGKCQEFFESKYGFGKTFLTHSCTQALEMAAILMGLGPGDEVILPSYSYVSTANAFALRGCTLVFADCRPDYPVIDETKLQDLISPRTKALVIVHYGGMACKMEMISKLVQDNDIYLIEDAAAAIDAYYQGEDGKNIPLGSMGHMAAFSFHETKNISCGEGGMLVVNDASFHKKALDVWNRGTNRSAFEQGMHKAYEWVSLGSACAPSEINAAWLWAQLEQLENSQKKRKAIWNWYFQNCQSLLPSFEVEKPVVPNNAHHNFHVFYLLCADAAQRGDLINHLKSKGILSVFHYQCLHQSPYFQDQYKGIPLSQAEKYQNRLLRLPLFADFEKEKFEKLLLE